MELSIFLKETGSNKLPDWCPSEVRDFIFETAVTLNFWAKVCKKLS